VKRNFFSVELHSSNLYLFVIIFIAACLRLYHLNYQSLWYDELHSVIGANPASDIFSVIEYSKTDQPPAFFILLHYWFKLFAYNEFYARLLSAIIGIAGVVSVFFLGKEVHTARTGLLASFITSLNWFHLYYSQEVRFYGLLFLLTTLSFLYFIRCNKTADRVNLVLYILTSVALIYTHYFGMVVMLTQLVIFLWLICTGKTDRRTIIFSLIAAVTIALAFVPWIPNVLKDNMATTYWIGMPDYDFLLTYYYIYIGHNKYLVRLYAIFGLILLYHVFLVKKNDASQNQKWPLKKAFILLILWAALSYLLPLIYSLVKMPMLHERYTIIALPAIFIMIALGFSYINSYALRAILVVAIIIATVHNFTHVTHYYSAKSKEQYREAVQAVINTNKADSLLSKSKIFSDQAWHYNFYFLTLGATNRAIDTYARDFSRELANEDQVWILQGFATEGVDVDQQRYLDGNFELSKNIQLTGASAKLYTKKNALVFSKSR
jgi:uncharacterized membrane protein